MSCIFVCIKQVPDTEMRIKINSDSTSIDSSNIKWVISPYDENAIEAALQQKALHPELKVIVASLGSAQVKESLRVALAMGCDEALHIESEQEQDPYVTAKIMAKAIKKQNQDIFCVYTGHLGIDKNHASFSQHLAEFLNLAHITKVVSIKYETSHLEATKEIENGNSITYKAKLPCLIATGKGLNTPRYPSLPGIMKAKKKPLNTISLESLGHEESLFVFKNYRLPQKRKNVEMLEGDNLDELASKLVDKIINEASAL